MLLNATIEPQEEIFEDMQQHTPVMMEEILQYINLPIDGCFVDCTVGLGGHSLLISRMLGPEGHLVAIDRDRTSLEIAKEKLSGSSCKTDFIHGNFRHIGHILSSLGIEQVDGLLFDLGISSFQLDNPERGFSFRDQGPLDMRMNQDECLVAYDLINSLSEREISRILKEYGEERYSTRIARYIVFQRDKVPIQSTHELKEVILRAVPRSYLRQKIHPATRTFQAFRIAVNRELEVLEPALEEGMGFLKTGGRMCVISFHSLEDRIVKHKFIKSARDGGIKLITKKPQRPTEDEMGKNNRARSAKLRVIEKI